jgi:hypothetical protein
MGPHETQSRDHVCTLAPADWAKAVVCAERIHDPWCACQAFAWCGRFAPPPDSAKLIDRAFRLAEAGKDVYQRLAASAWPLRALVELGFHDQAERESGRVAGLASEAKPPSSRSEACYLVFQAVAIAKGDLGRKALRWLLSACQPIEHWRQEVAARYAIIEAVSIGLYDQDDALLLVQDMRLRNNIVSRLARGEAFEPRSFFWTNLNKISDTSSQS